MRKMWRIIFDDDQGSWKLILKIVGLGTESFLKNAGFRSSGNKAISEQFQSSFSNWFCQFLSKFWFLKLNWAT